MLGVSGPCADGGRYGIPEVDFLWVEHAVFGCEGRLWCARAKVPCGTIVRLVWRCMTALIFCARAGAGFSNGNDASYSSAAAEPFEDCAFQGASAKPSAPVAVLNEIDLDSTPAG